MTKSGYTQVIMPNVLHSTLKTMASSQGLSIAKFLASRIDTGIDNSSKKFRYAGPSTGSHFFQCCMKVCGNHDLSESSFRHAYIPNMSSSISDL